MEHPLTAELAGAISEVATTFDRAGVGVEIGRAAAGSIPQLARQRDPEVVEETVLAATSNVVAIMDGLRHGVAAPEVPVPTVSLQWVNWLISRDIDVAAVPWAYNFGAGRMADALRESVARLDLPGEDRWQLAEGMSRYVQTYVESICGQMVEHYTREYERWRGGSSARRRSLVQQLLGPDAVDATAIGRELGYALDRPHLAAIVWATPEAEGRPTAAALEGAAELLLRSCGASDLLVVSNGDTSAWAWGTGAKLTDLLGDRVMVESGMLGALGTIAGGREGFVASHLDAERARRVARLLAKRDRAIVPYRSVALTALLAQDPDQALRFVERELGQLTDPTDSARRLRATLAIYLEEGMRPVRTARRLGVHQNTVAYRIGQAESAIGRPVGERRLELETALRLADALDALRHAGRSAL